MNRDLSDDFWRTEVTSDNSLCSEAFQLNQKSYSENWLLELCQRRSIVSVWWWRHSTFNDLLQQEHDSCRMQLRDLWQETADHYLLLEALMLWIKMYRYFNQDLHQSSEFEVLHDCYDSSYASSLIAILMTTLMTILKVIVDCSSLEHRLVSKSTLFKVSLCSSELYK